MQTSLTEKKTLYLHKPDLKLNMSFKYSNIKFNIMFGCFNFQFLIAKAYIVDVHGKCLV